MVTRCRKELKKDSLLSDKKINWKNKKLMDDKILSYSPALIEGINKYKDANLKFTCFLLLTALFVSIPPISFMICIVTVVYLIKMFQLIKFRNINNIVNVLSRDLAFRGIYDKGKTKMLIDDFTEKFGDDIAEYTLLTQMIDKYESLVQGIEAAIKNINLPHEECVKSNVADDTSDLNVVNDNNVKKTMKKQLKNINDKFSLTYRNEKGEIKKINRAIEFFQDKDNDSYNGDTVVLQSKKRGKDSKLTIYLHKKTPDVQSN